MSFSNSELQQLKAILSDRIRTLEEDKAFYKQSIKNLVALKQPFKKAGTKSVVDKYNGMIREQYKDVDKADKQLKKFRGLQESVKRELADQVDAERIQKAAVSLTASIRGLVNQKAEQAATDERRVFYVNVGDDDAPAPTEALKRAMNSFHASIGNLQIGSGSASIQGTVLGGLQTGGVASPALPGWSDYKFEDFPKYQPPYTTLELRTDGFGNPVPNRIINPGFEVTQRPVDTGMKPSNPKDAIGSGKLPLHLWPATATAMGSIGFLNGMLKYGRANFRAIGIRASIYADAAKRHIDAWFEGEECDPDDGVPHLAAALACLGIIVDADAAGLLNDDRNVRGGYRKLVDRLTPHVARLKALHASKNPKHYTIADNANLV